MITAAAGIMKPLPVRPIDTVVVNAPVQAHRSTRQIMKPLPMPAPDRADMVDALRATAFQRMLDRLDVQPLPILDPRA
ncbi:MAG: hypothetical protein ABI200_04460 [Gaiellales bacterium]